MGLRWSPTRHAEVLVAEHGVLAPIFAELAAKVAAEHGNQRAHQQALEVVRVVNALTQSQTAT